eukprot:gnl/TRDRNA2_/TRDRNA2_80215_c0_seq1.p2 gnl/TRDRNA2_/TRDRNA2_80215_c0~~gnl/TRDRNA2_/TRDRNA2_80215_c0_seq1.p2  ORF type:complete len:175 (-),score=33.92 gnl/TRDRNA2_/TRDRNA2_80215_c0_seq1:70-594(-)
MTSLSQHDKVLPACTAQIQDVPGFSSLLFLLLESLKQHLKIPIVAGAATVKCLCDGIVVSYRLSNLVPRLKRREGPTPPWRQLKSRAQRLLRSQWCHKQLLRSLVSLATFGMAYEEHCQAEDNQQGDDFAALFPAPSTKRCLAVQLPAASRLHNQTHQSCMEADGGWLHSMVNR